MPALSAISTTLHRLVLAAPLAAAATLGGGAFGDPRSRVQNRRSGMRTATTPAWMR